MLKSFSRAGRSASYALVEVKELRAERLNGTVRRSASQSRRTARSSHASCDAMIGCCSVTEVQELVVGGDRRIMSIGRYRMLEGKWGTDISDG